MYAYIENEIIIIWILAEGIELRRWTYIASKRKADISPGMQKPRK